MVQEALRYAAAQAAGLPGVASMLEKDSFLAPLLAGDAAPFLSTRGQECELATMSLCHACPNSFSHHQKARIYAEASLCGGL